MSEDLSIQQKRSSTPYLIGGLAAGGLGGYGLSKVEGIRNWATDPATLERLKEIGEKPDTVELSTKQKASLDGLKAKLEELKAAEAELKAAEKGIPTDPKLAAELEAAKTAHQAEFEKLLEAEKKNVSGGTVKEVPSFKEMQAGMTGDAKQVTRDFGHYENTLKPNYDSAIRTAKTTPEYTTIAGKRNNFATKLDAYYKDVYAAHSIKDPVARKKAIKALDKKLNFINGEYIALTKDQILEQAYKDGQMQKITNKKWYSTADYTRTWTDKAGKKHVEYYNFNDGVKLKDLRKAEAARVQGLKDALRSEIEATHQEFVNAQQELNNFANRKEFKATSRSGRGISGNYVCNYADITGAKLDTLKAELEVVEKLRNGEKLTKRAEKTIASGLEAKYGFNIKEVKGLADLQTTLSKRIPLAEEYAGLQEALKASKGGAERIAAYEQELNKVVQSNKNVKNAANKIKELAKKYGINIETATNVDEAKLKEIVEGKIKGSAIETRLTNAQAAFDKAVAEGATKVDDVAKEAAQGKVNKFKGELEKMGKEFCSTSKGKMALVIGGTAVAGALIAMAMKPKNNA